MAAVDIFCQYITRHIFLATFSSGWVLLGSLLHSVFQHGIFLEAYFSQVSVVTCLRHIFNDDFIANLLLNLLVKGLKIGQQLLKLRAEYSIFFICVVEAYILKVLW